MGRTTVVPSKETKTSAYWASPSMDNASCAALFADSATEDDIDIDSGAEGFKLSVKLHDREPNDLIQETMIRANCAVRFVLALVMYSPKLGDQTGQKTTVSNAKDMYGPDQATQNIAY
jgi:hypothetical protein